MTDRTAWLASLAPAIAVIVLTILAYLPALNAGFIWDDPDYVINNANLRTLTGLRNIWLDPRSLPQYYPLVHTTFWVEYHLWQLWPAGYHAVNVLLHAGGAVLLALLLRRLRVPGAWLAACVFAVHPVHVESVAWVTERKNVLSGVFYLAAFLAYARAGGIDGEADRPFNWRLYALSLLLFIGALLSKTVTCSLPAAIALVIWWKRGRIDWREDLARLAPFFVVGALLALNTARLERQHVGAVGAEWDYSFIERCLIAGRAAWFYLGKLFWPVRLAFIYPKWSIDAHRWWQYAFPVAWLALLAGLWLARRRIGRGPIVAMLFFCGTLLPALGFFNVYPMRYSFVADHFQYHASLGVIVLVCALLWTYARPRALSALVLIPLAALTFRQARIYQDVMTLWTDTLKKNPDSWMVETNLGHAYVERNQVDEAQKHYERALALAPNLPEPHWNVGIGLAVNGKDEAAMEQFNTAIAIDPHFAKAYYSRGNLYFKQGNLDQARADYETALKYSPGEAEAHFNLGLLLEKEGNLDGAIAHYRAAVANRPDYAAAFLNLGNALFRQHRFAEAAVYLSQAVRTDPGNPLAHVNLGAALLELGRNAEAAQAFRAALRIDPGLSTARRGLERATQLGSFPKAGESGPGDGASR